MILPIMCVWGDGRKRGGGGIIWETNFFDFFHVSDHFNQFGVYFFIKLTKVGQYVLSYLRVNDQL